MPGASEGVSGSDVVDFLFGGELSVMGIKQDVHGWSFSWENVKETWAEEPLWLNVLNTASLGATFVAPVAKPILRGTGLIGRGSAMTLSDLKAAGLVEDSVKSLNKADMRRLNNLTEARSRYARFREMDQAIVEGGQPPPGS